MSSDRFIINIENENFISIDAVNNILGIKRDILENYVLSNKIKCHYTPCGDGISKYYIRISDLEIIKDKAAPILDLYNSVSRIEDFQICLKALYLSNIKRTTVSEYKLLLEVSHSNFERHIPYYYQRGLRIEEIYKFAKQHALLEVTLDLKKRIYGSIPVLFSIIKDEQFAIKIPGGNSLQYFYKIISKAEKQGIPEVLIHGLKGSSSNNSKVTKVVKNIILYFARNGNKISNREITRQVNTIILALPTLNGRKELSEPTIAGVLRDPTNRNTVRIYRDSPNFLNDLLLPYLSLIKAEYPCDSFEMDGTKLQFAWKGDKSMVVFIYIIYVIDSFSKRIIGYAIGKNENSFLAKKALEMAIATTGYKIATEIITDKGPAFSGDMKAVEEYTKYAYGVKWIHDSNPKRKAVLERLIRTIQSVFLQPKFGYIGAGIKSKQDKDRPNGDILILLRDSSNLNNVNFCETIVDEIFHSYNINPVHENNLSPTELYRSKRIKNGIKMLHWQIPYIFWNKHKCKVLNSTVTIFSNKREFIYKTYSADLAVKIHEQRLDCYFNYSGSKQLFIFKENSDQFLGILDLQSRVHKARINQNSTDKKAIIKHAKDKKKMKEDLIQKMDNMDSYLKNSLGKLPNELISYKLDSKADLDKVDLASILNIPSEEIKEAEIDLYNTPKEIKRRKLKSSENKMNKEALGNLKSNGIIAGSLKIIKR